MACTGKECALHSLLRVLMVASLSGMFYLTYLYGGSFTSFKSLVKYHLARQPITLTSPSLIYFSDLYHEYSYMYIRLIFCLPHIRTYISAGCNGSLL